MLNTIIITGYNVIETLYQGRHSAVYRAAQQGGQQGQSVIIKIPFPVLLSATQTSRLHREFELRQRITSKYVVNYLELKPDATYGYLLIEEDDHADTLLNHIPSTGLTLPNFLHIAIQLTEGLRNIHAGHVIHKDIKPSNIIYQPDSGMVKYIDFNSASLLNQYQQTTAALTLTTEATLAYVSPEQTGRINRTLDYRTDFYSLGITFYQLLCGKLPFEAKNAAELIHCHLAKQPLAPYLVKSDIPKQLSDIIMKLLQKDADNRYQSAYGILADLKRCSQELTQKGEIAPFALAEDDIAEYFFIPQKLYGRESELARLTQAYNHINQGQTEIIMITGAAGSGKSVLVQELQPVISAKQGYFLMGKFEFLKRDIAYSAITQAFQAWIKQLLASSEEEIAAWKTRLLAVLGNQGQLLIDVIPDLELIIGKQPPVDTLDPEQTKNRFHWFFQQFITILVAQYPFVIFLDDWQWADTASLTLLETLLTNPGAQLQHLLLIGAYRDNEVDDSHPALVTLANLQKANVAVQAIPLFPLEKPVLNQWVADAVHYPPDRTYHLTNVIYEKTEGYPFFIKVFLQTLYEQGLLTLVENHWQWNLKKICQLPATENVITFMIQQIQQLPSVVQDTLQFASCLGHRFSFDQLQHLMQKPDEQLLEELQLLVEKGLLLKSDENLLRFAHDRIQETVYQQIPIKKRAAIHLVIGRLLQASIPAEADLEQWATMVNHLNQGKSLIIEPNQQLTLAQLNLTTAQKAKAAVAYVTALNYLKAGEEYLTAIDSDKIWQENYDLAYEFYKALAEMEYLNGHFAASAGYRDLVLKQARTLLEKVDIYSLDIIQKTMMAHYQEALDTGYQALGLLGVDLQAQDLQALLQEEFNQVKENLKNKTMPALLEAPLMTNAKIKAIMKLFDKLAAASYFVNPSLFALTITRTVNFTLHYGNTEESAGGYVHYGLLLITQFKEITLGYEFGLLAIQLSDKFHHLVSQSRTNCVHGAFLHPWRKPLRETEIYFDRAQQAGLAAGEFQYLGYLAQLKVIYLFYQGIPLTTIESELKKLLRLSYVRTNQMAIGDVHGLQMVICNLRGQTPEETAFQDDVKTDVDYQADWQKEKNFFVLVNYLILKAQALYLHGQLAKAQEILLSATQSPLFSTLLCHFTVPVSNFYHSLILAALYPKVDTDTQQSYWQQLEANQRQLKIWADNCPENFSHKYLLVAAEMARITQDRWEAAEKYDQAIQLAKEQGFIQEQALANELAAKFWLAQHKTSYAPGLLQAAYQLYERWGAKHKVDQLTLQYSEFLKPADAAKLSSFNISGEETISADSLRLLDLTSILKTSQTISSEVNLAKLLVNIMTILIENAGAQKGAFLLVASGNLLVQAEYTLKGQIHTLQQQPLSQWESGARSLIEYVKRTQQPVLLGNASTDPQFGQEPYISAHRIQSVLCLPVVRHHQLKGILYMENNLAPYIFTQQHLQILTILASQIAISLENAAFYESIRSISEQLNLALQSGNVGTWSWNIQTNKIIWDPYMCALHGITQEEFGQTYESAIALVHPEDKAQVEQAVKRTLEENAPFDIEYRIIKPDKSIHVMASQGNAYRDDKGRAEQLLGIVWDITQRKQLEQERLQALIQAEEKERCRAEDAERYRKDLEDFINMVCHEIRNPLTGIYGNIDFLQETITSLKTLREALSTEIQPTLDVSLQKLEEITQEIEQCIKHQKTIIDDVLDLSKLEAGKIFLANQPFRLQTIIYEVIKIFAAPLARKNLSLIWEPPELDLWIKGDANRLKMILINLMGNALKFTEHGHIKINLQVLEATPDRIKFTLSVEDTGLGMTADEISHLFQRFTRATATEYEGTGLGLVICKRFIELMGGKIEVKSQKGQGSQFIIQLSCETASAQAKPTPQLSSASPLPVLTTAKHILVVEDNKLNQKMLCKYLTGYTCDVANNGQEAVDKWEKTSSSFDLIFMDIEMPRMNGIDATKTIRKREQELGRKKTPIIGLSAYTSSDYIENAKKAGMDDYITKPYEKKAIENAVNIWTIAQPQPSPDKPIESDFLLTAIEMVKGFDINPEAKTGYSPSLFGNKGLPIASRIWMPETKRTQWYPILDRLSDELCALGMQITKPEAKFHKKISKTGWQLYSFIDKNECWAVLNLEQEAHVDKIVKAIQASETQLQAQKKQRGHAYAVVISFSANTMLDAEINKIISNLHTQFISHPRPFH
jgi:PAS domain S-box-containing protein